MPARRASAKACPTKAQVAAAKRVIAQDKACKTAPKKTAPKKKASGKKKAAPKKVSKKASGKKGGPVPGKNYGRRDSTKRPSVSASKPYYTRKTATRADGRTGKRPSARAYYDAGYDECFHGWIDVDNKSKCLRFRSNGSPYWGSCNGC